MSFAASLLRTHVGRSPSVTRPLADIRLTEREPKVNHVGLIVLIQQDVTRLHVPVDKPLFVSVVQCLGDRGDEFGRFPILDPTLLERC